MIAAVIPVDGQLHFIKATGPQKTIASHADAIYQFIRSARPTKWLVCLSPHVGTL
jgi:hypothetical protein